MTGPLDVPSRLISGAFDGLGSLGEAARRAPEIQRDLLALIRSLDRRLEGLPAQIELTLREHFESQRVGIESLKPELERNREAAESLPGRIDLLLEETHSLRSEVAALARELGAVREAVEPLRDPAERIARLNDRLPGSG